MKKDYRLTMFTILLLMAAVFVPGTAFAQEEEPDVYYVNTPELDIRARASDTSKLLGKLYKYEEVRLIRKPRNGWVKGTFQLKNSDFVDGYVKMQSLAMMGDDPIPESKLQKPWKLLTSDPNLSGELKIRINDGEFEANYTIFLTLEKREVFDKGSEDGYYNEGYFWHYPYDAKTGYLSMCGHLWYQD